MISARASHAGSAVAPSTAGVIVNVVAFQIGWFACVLGAAHNLPWAGTATAAVIVAAHIIFAARPQQELKLVALALAIGAVWDSLLLSLHWLDFTSGVLIDGVAPHWILAMWALFAITLNHSLAWLQSRCLTAAMIGAVAGPLAYWGGARLGAVVFVAPLFAALALSLGWALFTPLLARFARRCNSIAARG